MTLRVPQVRDGISTVDYLSAIVLSKKQKSIDCYLDDYGPLRFDQKGRQDNGKVMWDLLLGIAHI